MTMLELFNSREVATFFWILVLLAFSLSFRDVRKSVANLILHLLSLKLILPVFLLAIYISVFVVLLTRIELWNDTLLKDTIIWFFSAGMVTIHKYVSAPKGRVPIRQMLFDNLMLVVILEFLMNTYTFALWVEFLIVPIVALIVMTKTYAQAKKSSREVVSFLTGIQGLIGLALLSYVFYSAVQDYQNLGTLDTLRSFLLPLLLSIAIIPAAYLMAVCTTYESLYIGFKFGNAKGQDFVRYCKWRIFLRCGLSTRAVAKLRPLDLMHLQNKDELSAVLSRVDMSEQQLSELSH